MVRAQLQHGREPALGRRPALGCLAEASPAPGLTQKGGGYGTEVPGGERLRVAVDVDEGRPLQHAPD
jgi:hypothetical protein